MRMRPIRGMAGSMVCRAAAHRGESSAAHAGSQAVQQIARRLWLLLGRRVLFQFNRALDDRIRWSGRTGGLRLVGPVHADRLRELAQLRERRLAWSLCGASEARELIPAQVLRGLPELTDGLAERRSHLDHLPRAKDEQPQYQ